MVVYVTRYLKDKPKAEVAHKTGTGPKFGKFCTWKLLLNNYDQIDEVSTKLVLEKGKFLELFGWGPRHSFKYDFRILEDQRNSAKASAILRKKKRQKKNGFNIIKKFSGFLGFSGSPGSRTFFENPRDRDPEHS